MFETKKTAKEGRDQRERKIKDVNCRKGKSLPPRYCRKEEKNMMKYTRHDLQGMLDTNTITL